MMKLQARRAKIKISYNGNDISTDLAPYLKSFDFNDVMREHRKWQNILGIRTVGEFNQMVLKGESTQLINVSEALQDKKLSNIADEIAERGAKLVLIAGPSSSGKTTTAKRREDEFVAGGAGYAGIRGFPMGSW